MRGVQDLGDASRSVGREMRGHYARPELTVAVARLGPKATPISPTMALVLLASLTASSAAGHAVQPQPTLGPAVVQQLGSAAPPRAVAVHREMLRIKSISADKPGTAARSPRHGRPTTNERRY